MISALYKKYYMRFINRILNNNGSTMVETLVSFVVLVIVIAALYGMVRFSSNLRMRAVDTAKVRNTFNSEIYKNGSSPNVDEYHYIGRSAPDNLTMFSLKLNEKTDNSNLYKESSGKSRTEFTDSVYLSNVDAVGYVSVDPVISEENLVQPKALEFEFNKAPIAVPTPSPTPEP